MARKFSHALAIRDQVPMIIGIVGPSFTGKTKSALRLAAGMERQDGKKRPTFLIDTEGKRGKHYAKEHSFQYVEFPPPHGSLDYLEVVDYAIDRGAGRIVIDSMSHEHDGEGGALEVHRSEVDRMGGGAKNNLPAWSLPKQRRRKLINRMVSSGVDFILCFRAAPKIQPLPGKQPLNLGWMPVGGREFMFEMGIKLLLLPGAKGVPTFRSSFPGEQEMIKLPSQFEPLFTRSPQLSEDIGEQLAIWAAGGDVIAASGGPVTVADLATRLGACSNRETLDLLSEETKAIWRTLSEADRKRLKAIGETAATRVTMLEAQAAAAARAMAESGGHDEEEGGFATPPPADDIPPPEAPDRAA